MWVFVDLVQCTLYFTVFARKFPEISVKFGLIIKLVLPFHELEDSQNTHFKKIRFFVPPCQVYTHVFQSHHSLLFQANSYIIYYLTIFLSRQLQRKLLEH